MFGKCNKYSKRIGLKNIFKKQFMIFFFFPLRWYKIFGSINKYQGPISGILIYFPRIRIPIIPANKTKTLSKPQKSNFQTPHFHTDTKRENHTAMAFAVSNAFHCPALHSPQRNLGPKFSKLPPSFLR